MPTSKEDKYMCGKIYRDKEGRISHGQDSIYLLVSRNLDKEVNKFVWTAVRMSVWFDDGIWTNKDEEDYGKWMGWPGGQIVELYDSDVDRLEFIGILPFVKGEMPEMSSIAWGTKSEEDDKKCIWWNPLNWIPKFFTLKK